MSEFAVNHTFCLLQDLATGSYALDFDDTVVSGGAGGPYRVVDSFGAGDRALRRAGLVYVGHPARLADPADMEERAALFSERLAEAMEAAGWGKEELYGAVGENGGDAYMLALERCLDGQFPSDAATLVAIARGLGVSADWLLGL